MTKMMMYLKSILPFLYIFVLSLVSSKHGFVHGLTTEEQAIVDAETARVCSCDIECCEDIDGSGNLRIKPEARKLPPYYLLGNAVQQYIDDPNGNPYGNRINCWDINGLFNGDWNGGDPTGPYMGETQDNLYNTFAQKTTFNEPIQCWDVSNVSVFQGMFFLASSFNQPLDEWDVSGSITTMGQMFYGASSFNQPLPSWDVSQNNDFTEMFYSSAFNQDISGWDVSGATSISSMFESNTVFNQNLCPWQDKIDFVSNPDITAGNRVFYGTSCPVTTTPTAQNGLWCVDCSTTSPPTTNPPPPPNGGGASGDPHIKTWSDHHGSYDFMGECDLVLTKSTGFSLGLGLEIQIRTTIRSVWSFISAIAVRIGEDTLEVSSDGEMYWNGMKNPDIVSGHYALAEMYPIRWNMGYVGKHATQKTTINLGSQGLVEIKVYNGFIDVKIDDAHASDFGDAVGLMGNFDSGDWVARDGKTIMTDPDEFGMEWQVRDTERMLFHDVGTGPQYPKRCNLPPKTLSKEARRLANDPAFVEKAKKACRQAAIGTNINTNDCYFDVMATGDLGMAEFHAF